MTTRILIAGFFLRRTAWSPVLEGGDVDALRDNPTCDLPQWLAAAEALALAADGPVEIIGHSFGGYLAQCLAARLGARVSHLWLLSALTSQGGSALESYQESGQHAVSDLCRLDMPSGCLRLQHPERFLTLLGQGVALAPAEPVQLLLDPPPPQITRLRCPVSYVITQQDRLTPPLVQQAFARHLHARQIFWPGGHVAPIHTTGWLTAHNTAADS